MRISATATSLSWIPSEAVKGMTKMPFEVGLAHYDLTPPSTLGGPEALEVLRSADRFRFANRLEAWIETDDRGRIIGFGQAGGGMIGSTTMRFGKKRAATFAATSLPDLQPEPEAGDGWVRFTQTAGGRTGVPTPRRVNRPPFVQVTAPLAWSTLQLTIHADGQLDTVLAGASPFPRHWVYDDRGELVAKTAVIDYQAWYRTAFGVHSPWGDEDAPTLVSTVETALERTLSEQLMKAGDPPEVRKVKAAREVVSQGDRGGEIFLLLDGVLSVEVDGAPIAELGPGALFGERAVLAGGARTATLRAVTACKVAVVRRDRVDQHALLALSEGHHREDQRASSIASVCAGQRVHPTSA